MSLKWQIPGGIMLFVTDHAAIRNCAIFTLEVHFAVVIKAILQVFVSLLEICRNHFMPFEVGFCQVTCLASQM